jgi:leucyl aminopeptidase
VIEGEGLLEANYPACTPSAGRRSGPRAADDRDELGRGGPPLVCFVGKGVVFDTGGLDIKPVGRHAADEEGHGRRRARPGAGPDGHGRRLPVRLAVLSPVVENAISGDAMRPGDVLASRKGSPSRSATPTPRAG